MSYQRFSKYLTNENKTRILIMRGLPFKVSIHEIIDFFANISKLKSNDIIIEEINGKRSGSAIVFFENQ